MDVLESGPERAPRAHLPRPVAALLATSLAVAAAGAVSVPGVERASAPPVVTASTSGGTAAGGRLRVWLLLGGPPDGVLTDVAPRLPGSTVRVTAPQAFSPRGDAVVRLDVDPTCPAAVPGLAEAALDVRVGRARAVRVPVDTSGLVETSVRDRCAGRAETPPPRGPRVRAGVSEAPGVLRALVDLGAPGPEVLVVTAVTAGPGLSVEPLTPLPLRVAPGRRGVLVLDLRQRRCYADPEAPPFVLEYAAEGEVEPVVEASLRGRLLALQTAGC